MQAWVEIARRRLQNPSKSESNLLQVGRAAYENANEEALALLQGIDFVPVQRNRGIDAFVKGDIDGYPIPIRVQRPEETILETADLLYRAGSTKNAPLMILVALRAGGYFAFANELPPGVVVVEGPGLAIRKVVEEVMHGQHNDKIVANQWRK
jgi:site-specific DNA-methyltransferase (adenine-specific)